MDTTEQLHFHFSLSCIGEGNGNPLQCSCLENPRDGGAWWAVSGVTQSRTRLKRLSSSSRIFCIQNRGLDVSQVPAISSEGLLRSGQSNMESVTVSGLSKSEAQRVLLLLLLSLQPCLTVCDPIDCSPPGSPIPGILQARTLGWVAISFSNA